MARGQSLEAAGKIANAHIEGVSIARRISGIAERSGLATPIATGIHELVNAGGNNYQAILQSLMSLELGHE